ncbi:ABC transporter permease [Antrihabitans cavernicola]|uniref:Transport permease protein n=1 Tax=Antrihabitans cavernicola TaxID=2495913 RepID=A0A5A7S635_9NOCA|nr:ABC transporter permease [Spelaeibacter cavernicola]KAA0021580.1 peptide ABC transporter permease [Spelaeibacter cavernicola]
MSTQTQERTHVALPEVARPHGESSPFLLLRHSAIQCKRLLMGWLRDAPTIIQMVVYPALMLVMFRIVLGDSISSATGQPSVYGTVPMITLVAAMSGAVVSALGLNIEQRTGLLGRFATMPIHRGAGLIGRLMAETIRIFVTTLLILAAGFGLGLRFEQGWLAAVAMLIFPILFGLGFAVFVTMLATLSKGGQLIQLVAIITLLMTFFNSGFVPVRAYPPWLQNTVANQPMSCAIEAMKGLTLGGPVGEPLLKTLAWSLGMILLFLYPAILGYRKAAASGR